MRRWIALAGLLTGVAAALAAPLPPAPPPPTDEAVERADHYAHTVARSAGLLAPKYVRPVEAGAVLAAGVAEMYAVAREPMPAEVRDALASATTYNRLVPAARAARLHLGDHPALPANQDVLVTLDGFADALDPYCGVVPLDEFMGGSEREGMGLGLSLAVRRRGPRGVAREPVGLDLSAAGAPAPGPVSFPWTVIDVVPGGPAADADIRPGDRVVSVNGVPVTASTRSDVLTRYLPAAEARLRARTPAPREAARGPARLALQRPDGRTFAATLDPRPFEPRMAFGTTRDGAGRWGYWLDEPARLALVRVSYVYGQTPRQVSDIVERLERDGLRGLVLDLRYCPGGYLTPSIALASVFLPNHLIATANYPDPEETGDRTFRSNGVSVLYHQAGDFPIVALVGPETSGGGEMLAAALQDNGRAKVAGQRTRGKGTIQQGVDINLSGRRYKLTVGALRRPNGVFLQRLPDATDADPWGVRPDPEGELPLPPGVLALTRDWWTLQTLRPEWSLEGLPLDDLTQDAQLQKALSLLRREVAGRAKP